MRQTGTSEASPYDPKGPHEVPKGGERQTKTVWYTGVYQSVV